MAARRKRRFLALCALAWLAQRSATAQTLARFVPLPPDGAASGALELRFVREQGDVSEPQPWPASASGWLYARFEGAQHNYDALVPLSADATRLRVERDGPGPALIGWDLPPRVERTSTAELRAFLARRAQHAALPPALEALPANESVSLLRLESLAFVARAQEGKPDEPSAIATSKSGQRMELRALFDPTFLEAGSEFVFKLYLPEGGGEGVSCRAIHLTSRAASVLECAPDGSLRVRLAQSGPWMLEAVRLRALTDDSGAALELASSTLVFIVRPASGAKAGGR